MLKVLNLVLAMSLLAGVSRQEKQASSADQFATLFSEIGFSPSCVSKSLALCENTRKASAPCETSIQQNLILDTIAKLRTAKNPPRNCVDLLHRGDTQSGVRTVYPYACCPDLAVAVFCDQTTDGGGWTVFQHRQALPQREDFFRNWVEYRLGFGDLDGGEFWLGLDIIHALVSNVLMELRVDLEDFKNKRRWAKYNYFYIGNASDKYRLDLGSYSGNAGDSFSGHTGHQFSTRDQDNDAHSSNCAQTYKGGWWYTACHASNLNGLPHEGNHTSHADGINWFEFRGHKYSLKSSSLSLRPKFTLNYKFPPRK